MKSGQDQPADRASSLALALVVAARAARSWPGTDKKYVTAEFPRTVSLYEGSDVKILGVAVGKVETVTPVGHQRHGEVVTTTASTRCRPTPRPPSSRRRSSVTGSSSSPRSTAAASVLADNATLGTDRTATPLELDEIFGSLNDLTIALGPDGANKPDGEGVGAADPAARLDRPQLRRPGRAVQQDPEEPRQAHQDPGRQQGRAVRHRSRRSRSSPRPWPTTTTPSASSTTRSPAAPTCSPASARTWPPCCEPGHRRWCRSAASSRRTRRSLTTNIARPQPGLQGPGQAARRAGRDAAGTPRRR